MAIENSSYRCISSREATDVVSRGRVAAEKAEQAKTRVADLEKKVSKRTFYFLVANIKAQGKRLGRQIV